MSTRMQVAVCFLLVLPFVFCAPQERFIEPFISGGAFSTDVLKCDLQLMVNNLGSDPTEVACESECHKLLTEGHVFNYGCPLVCHGFQNLAQFWHITADTSMCTNLGTTTASA